MARKKNNPTAVLDLEEVNAFPFPVSEVDLTKEERDFLDDPQWISEDEADVIVCRRREAAQGHLARPFREYLRSQGYGVED